MKTAYLVLYMFSFLIAAVPLSSYGVLIPFFAEDLGIEETEYSVLFVMLSVGNLLACALYKVLEWKKRLPRHHAVCMVGAVGMAILCLIMVKTRQKMVQCIVLSIFGMFENIFVMTVNICLLIAAPKQEIGFWISLSHGTYGIGSLFGPIIVSYLQKDVFIVLAVGLAIVAPLFHFMESPETKQVPPTEKETKSIRTGSMRLEVLISIAFCILAGVQATIAGWIPSYAVLANIQTKQNAARFSSIFWTLSTIFRFLFGCMKKTDNFKFTSLNLGQLATGIIVALLTIWHYPTLATYFCSILYGTTLSQLYPLLLSIPADFGIHFQDSQISNMMISVTVSEAVFSTPTGVLMNYNINMFFYSLLFFSCILWLINRMIIDRLSDESLSLQQKEQEMRPIQHQLQRLAHIQLDPYDIQQIL